MTISTTAVVLYLLVLGIALCLAGFALMMALAATGIGVKLEARHNDLQAVVAGLEGHRLRIDGNVERLWQSARLPAGRLVRPLEPGSGGKGPASTH